MKDEKTREEEEETVIEEMESETAEEAGHKKVFTLDWRAGCAKMKQCAGKHQISFRLVLLVVALAVGFGVKWEVSPRVTMGFQDYTVLNKTTYDFGAAEKRLADQAEQSAADGNSAPSNAIAPVGASCNGGL
ncbi:MAG: hypothetical protein WCG84_02645 [Candidatus Moraniibacteriota bacterium]